MDLENEEMCFHWFCMSNEHGGAATVDSRNEGMYLLDISERVVIVLRHCDSLLNRCYLLLI